MEILVKENSYKIDIDYKSDDKLKDFLMGRSESKFLIITDENVFSLYEGRIKSIMKDLEYFIFKITPGEESKSIENFVEINKFLVENNFNRGDAIIAFGGGVVGDLGGYVAASYLRGMEKWNKFYEFKKSNLIFLFSKVCAY